MLIFTETWILMFSCMLMRCSSNVHFDSLGRLQQVEYAAKAAASGGTTICARSFDHAVIVSWSKNTDKQSLQQSTIYRISQNLGVTAVGISSDCSHITNMIKEEVEQHDYVFASSLPSKKLAATIANYVHMHTIDMRYRPLGIRLVMCSYDALFQAQVFEVDSLGNLYKCKLSCLGQFSVGKSIVRKMTFVVNDRPLLWKIIASMGWARSPWHDTGRVDSAMH